MKYATASCELESDSLPLRYLQLRSAGLVLQEVVLLLTAILLPKGKHFSKMRKKFTSLLVRLPLLLLILQLHSQLALTTTQLLLN